MIPNYQIGFKKLILRYIKKKINITLYIVMAIFFSAIVTASVFALSDTILTPLINEVDLYALKDQTYYFPANRFNNDKTVFLPLNRWDLIFTGNRYDDSDSGMDPVNINNLIPGEFNHLLVYMGKDKNGLAYAAELNMLTINEQGTLKLICLGSDFGFFRPTGSDYLLNRKKMDCRWALRFKEDARNKLILHEDILLATVYNDLAAGFPYQIEVQHSGNILDPYIYLIDDGFKDGSSCSDYWMTLFEFNAGLCLSGIRMSPSELIDYFENDPSGRKAAIPAFLSPFPVKVYIRQLLDMGFELVPDEPHINPCDQTMETGVVLPTQIMRNDLLDEIQSIPLPPFLNLMSSANIQKILYNYDKKYCYSTPPDAVSHLNPVNTITGFTPEFSWQKSPCSREYELWIGDEKGNKIYSQCLDAENICSESVCSASPDHPLASGDYLWYIKAAGSHGSVWSEGAVFSVRGDGPPPSPVVQVSPSGSIKTGSPAFTWIKDPVATWYKIRVEDRQGKEVFGIWHPVSSICDDIYCSVTPRLYLTDNEYQWMVKSWNNNGRVWSEKKAFFVDIGEERENILKKIREIFSLIDLDNLLNPLTQEASDLFSYLMEDDPELPITFTPDFTGSDQDYLDVLPQNLSITLDCSQGCTSSEGFNLTGTLSLFISNLVSSENSLSMNLRMEAGNMKKNGVDIISGIFTGSLSMESNLGMYSAQIRFESNDLLTTHAGQGSGTMEITMPLLNLETMAFAPVAVKFNNWITGSCRLDSGELNVSQDPLKDTYHIEIDLYTQEEDIKGWVELDTTGGRYNFLQGQIQAGEWNIELNDLAFSPETCDYPIAGQALISRNNKKYRVIFTETCSVILSVAVLPKS